MSSPAGDASSAVGNMAGARPDALELAQMLALGAAPETTSEPETAGVANAASTSTVSLPDEVWQPVDSRVGFSLESYDPSNMAGMVNCSGAPAIGEVVCLIKCATCGSNVDMIRLLPLPGGEPGPHEFARCAATCCGRDYRISYDAPPPTFWISTKQ